MNIRSSREGSGAAVSEGLSKPRATWTSTSTLRMACTTSGGNAPAAPPRPLPPTSTKVISAKVVFFGRNTEERNSTRASGTLMLPKATSRSVFPPGARAEKTVDLPEPG